MSPVTQITETGYECYTTMQYVLYVELKTRQAQFLRAVLLQYVNIMPDNATGTGREGVGVMVLKGGSMINAQRRAAT